MINKALIGTVCALLVMGAAVGGIVQHQSRKTYHITCYSGSTNIWEGEGSDLFNSDNYISFDDEDGDSIVIYGTCIIEQNVDRAEYGD